MSSVNFCVDCKHRVGMDRFGKDWLCMVCKPETNPVTGKKIYLNCRVARISLKDASYCQKWGPEERKVNSWLTRLFKGRSGN